MVSEPLVSIIVPCYNSEKFVKDAINSVIKQAYQNWELIIIDDCSTDNSGNVVNMLAESDKRIKLFKNQSNSGVAASRNLGIDNSSGQYIAFLDSDDLWEPQKLQLQIAYMLNNNYGITYTAHRFINENNEICGKTYCPPNRINYKKLFYSNVICCSTAIVRKDLMQKYRFDEKVFHEDFVSWLLIVKETGYAWGLELPLTYYRIMNGTKSANKFRSAKGVYNIYRNYFEFGVIKSCWYMGFYGFYGVRKYLLRSKVTTFAYFQE